MKIKALILENFRAYKESTRIEFGDLTTIIGKNDVGKSSILEALEIFFNNKIVKMEKSDKSIFSEDKEKCKITVIFSDLSDSAIIDSKVTTSLKEEYLLNESGYLEIVKEVGVTTTKIFIQCLHPSNKDVKDLLKLKISDLKERANQLSISKDEIKNLGVSSAIREAIRNKFCVQDLALTNTCLELEEDGKEIYKKLEMYFPIYALFQQDRKNRDGDSDIQDPLKIVIREVLEEMKNELTSISLRVNERLVDVTQRTKDKLSEMDKDLIDELIPNRTENKWESAFKFEFLSEDNIPLNKRGSGVRRLVLMNFFRAEAERKLEDKTKSNIIYAIEEPETGLHPELQKKVVEAFLTLSTNVGCQVILTTHSPAFASILPPASFIFIEKQQEKRIVSSLTDNDLMRLANTLGVLPNIQIDSIEKLKCFICTEGKSDIEYIKNIFNVFKNNYTWDISDSRIILIPLGGDQLQHFVNYDYLGKLNKPEIHIYDSDVTKYEKIANIVNSRTNGSKAFMTKSREIENYIHPSIIESELDARDKILIDTNKKDWTFQWSTLDLESTVKKFCAENRGIASYNVKRQVGKLSSLMTESLLKDLRVYDEIKSWFDYIDNILKE